MSTDQKKGEIVPIVGLSANQAAYNPSPIGFFEKDVPLLAVRVEDKESDWLNRLNKTGGPYDPSCQFFFEKDGALHPVPNAPIFDGFEDPAGSWIDIQGEKRLLFSGVTVDFGSPGGPKVWTNLYITRSIYELSQNNPIVQLPGKDNRFCQSQTAGDIVWLSRPDKGEAFPGRIGFGRLTLQEILDPVSSQMLIKETKLLKFTLTEGEDGEWLKMGGNAIYSETKQLPSGETKEIFRIICHGATSDKKPIEEKQTNVEDDPYVTEKIHYKAYQGIIDPDRLDDVTELTQIAQASDFSTTPDQVKGGRYEDVVFPGGVINGYLYVGVGDRSIGRVKMQLL